MYLVTLTPLEVEYLHEYMAELDAIIEGDEGVLFPSPLLEKHDEIKEMLRCS